MGLHYSVNKDIRPFLFVTVILPLTSALTSLHTRFQISVYYFFIIFPVIAFIFDSSIRMRLPKNVMISAGTLLIFVSSYLLYVVVVYPDNIDIINLLKDLKPLLFLLLGFVFMEIFKDRQLDWSGMTAKRLLKYNCIASLLWFTILNNSNIIQFVTSDPYYTIVETARYSAVGITFVFLYFIAGISNGRKFDKFDLFYISIPLFLSGNRTYFFALGVLYLTNMIISSKNVTMILRRIAICVLTMLILIFGIFNLNLSLKNRLLSMFEIDLVVNELVAHRFAPFVDKLAVYNWYDYFLGRGIGETLFIPWFVYRENVDDFNIYMDNIYLTLYIKYGILSIFLGLLFCFFIGQTNTNKRFKFLLILYFGIIGLTTAFIYQSPFLFTLIILGTFSFNNKKGMVDE